MNDNDANPGRPGGRLAVTQEKVRTDLARLLGEGAADQLLERRNLPPGSAAELLGDRRLSPETLRFLFSLPGWSTDYPVKTAMALHPRCPLALLRILINSLRLGDLVQVMTSRDIARAGARMAAVLFGQRLPETALGRKKQLSRTGGRIVHEQLLMDSDPRMLEFLLGESPMLTEEDLLKLLRDPRVPREKVGLIASSERWNSRYQLRLELARHPLVTDDERLDAASALLLQDLQALLNDRNLSPQDQRLLYTVLRTRIEDQSDKEQLALARSRPGRYAINLLLGARREVVILELLKTGRLEQAQCLALANDPHSPGAVLEALARLVDPPGGKDALQEALQGNRALPEQVRALVDTGMVKQNGDGSDK